MENLDKWQGSEWSGSRSGSENGSGNSNVMFNTQAATMRCDALQCGELWFCKQLQRYLHRISHILDVMICTIRRMSGIVFNTLKSLSRIENLGRGAVWNLIAFYIVMQGWHPRQKCQELNYAALLKKIETATLVD